MESPQQVPISLDLSDLESQHAMDLDTSPNKTGSHGAEAAETGNSFVRSSNNLAGSLM